MMSRRDLFGAVRSMAHERDTFLLSELQEGPGKRVKLRELRRILEPRLGFLDLLGDERGEDLLISRSPPANPVLPSRSALEADGAFLGRPFIPPRIQGLIESYIGRKTGKDHDDPVVLDRIRAAIRAQKGEYWDQARERPISYRAGYRVLAYLAYQFPVVFVQSLHLLHDMAGDGLLKDRMRVLDAGSGPGTVPLAITEAWGRLSPGDVQIFALEQETENLEAYRSLVPAFAEGNTAVQVEEPIQADLRSVEPDDLPVELDLIVFGNVLNELRELSPGERAALVGKIAGSLAEDGTILILEPADLENSVALRNLTHALGKEGLSVTAPCTALWNTACRPDRCWSFREAPPVTPPRFMSLLASSEDGYRYLNTDIKFSYALLSKEGRTRENYRIPRGAKALRLSTLQRHLKHRVNVIVAKMSGDLGGGRGHYVYKVCDGTPQKPVFAVVPSHRAAHARALIEGRYGGIVGLENTLVRFNAARDAFNLFVDRFTRVKSLTGQLPGRGPVRGRNPAGGRQSRGGR
jgi:SAM-dependent methyltransferase